MAVNDGAFVRFWPDNIVLDHMVQDHKVLMVQDHMIRTILSGQSRTKAMMEGDCNVYYALFAVNVPIVRMVFMACPCALRPTSP